MTIKRHRRKVIVLVALVLAAALVSFVTTRKPEVRRVPTISRQEPETISLSGKLDALEKVTLRFQAPGRLSWVGVKEGDYVQKYQRIAALDQSEIQKKLERTLKDYLLTRWDFEQTKDDNKDKVLTDAIKRMLEKSQFTLDKLVIEVELVDLSKQFANLWTPIEGVVTKVNSPYAGVNITPAQAEFEIVNPQTVYFSATADQTDVVKLKEGMTGVIVLDSFPNLKLSGKILSISFQPKVDETTTAYEVKVKVDKLPQNQTLRLEMTGDINFAI